MDSLVKLNDIAKSYSRGKQSVQVLSDVNLSIARGEFVALMGPSGSGKTTLLNLIAGLDRPTAGTVSVNGENISAFSAGRLASWRAANVGFVFQFYQLLPVLSAEQNVEVPLFLTTLTRGERQRRVAAALELVGLSERAKHKPMELSGGQQQRVAIARAIVTDPLLLVCDEPTGDLDREMADQILELLTMLNRKTNKTIVMVTHDPRAANYASRRVNVDKGLLLEGVRRAA